MEIQMISSRLSGSLLEKFLKFKENNNIPNNNLAINTLIEMSEKFSENPENKGETTELLKLISQQKTQISELETKISEMATAGNSDENLQSEIARLQNIIDNSEKPDPILEADNRALREENRQLLEQLKNPPNGITLNENQHIIEIPPTIKPFLDEVAIRETNRTGKPVTPQMVLINLFWFQIKKGPGDHLPRTFSSREIENILASVKQNSNE